MPIQFDIIIPTFPVSDAAESVAYYRDLLGFEVTLHEEGYAHVRRGKAVIALYQRSILETRAGCEAFSPACKARATIFVEGLRDLYEDYEAKGVHLLDSPTEVPYGWDMQIADRDGNVLEFVQFKSA